MKSSLKEFFSSCQFIGLIIGFLSFIILMPLSVVLPSNIGWFGAHEDMRTYYLGWDFFRNTPWQFPISANPRYGMEISSSVFMTDTVPLLAIFFKLLSPILPDVFQYHGLWLLACFLLQGLMGWKLARLVTDNKFASLLISALFVFQIPFVSRFGHIPLMAQFFVLASIYILIQRRENFSLFWMVILIGAAGTNAYLLAMSMSLYFAEFAWRFSKNRNYKKSAVELLIVISVVVSVCALMGYFSVGSSVDAAATPYGLYRFNLLSPIDSNGWSYIIKDLPGGSGDYEGFAYLGLGFLFLLLCAAILLFEHRRDMKLNFPGTIYLYILMALFLMYAASAYVGIGPLSINIPRPLIVEKISTVFRSTGRFAWPALYLLLFFTVFVILRYAKKGFAIGVLVIALILQVSDTSAGWRSVRDSFTQSSMQPWSTTLQSPFWKMAATDYRAIRGLPAMNIAPNWSSFAKLADDYKLETDFIYTARVNYEKIDNLNKLNFQMINSGNYKSDVLYVVQPKWRGLAIDNSVPGRDLIALVDGVMVIAPNWFVRHPDEKYKSLTLADYLKPAKAGVDYLFDNKTLDGQVLVEGWAENNASSTGWDIGENGVWSMGGNSRILIPVEDSNFKRIKFDGFPLVSNVRNVVTVKVRVNDSIVHSHDLTASAGSFYIDLSDEELASIRDEKKMRIYFEFDELRSPKDLGINIDTRMLSFALTKISIN